MNIWDNAVAPVTLRPLLSPRDLIAGSIAMNAEGFMDPVVKPRDDTGVRFGNRANIF